MKLENLKEKREYYFYFDNYYCTGHISEIDANTIRLEKGSFCYHGHAPTAYDEAELNSDFVIGFAST
jgi:hypothetical protein